VLYHPIFSDFGGGEMVAAWVLQVLQEDHDTILWCEQQPDFQRVDARYGTSLAKRPPTVVLGLSFRAKLIQRIWPGRGLLLQKAILIGDFLRMKRRSEPRLWISTFNEAFFPCPGIQYIHCPSTLWIKYAPTEWSWLRRKLWARAQKLSWWIGSGSSLSNLPPKHHFISNSTWTANGLRELSGRSSSVVHPPVPPFAPGRPWAEREDRVICLGRWNPTKRMEVAVDIVAQARQNGADKLRLAFVGFWDSEDDAREQVINHCAGFDWIEWHENLARDELEELLGNSRYGLHAMLDEHFGIAIAEMMSAGCIVFSHNSGGPPEILNDDRQLYDDVEEGARIISHTVSSPALQSELHENARPLGLRYSPASFCGSIRAEIETFKKSERA
jgi:glycosyltransferase involved in cell wall biosynthesis